MTLNTLMGMVMILFVLLVVLSLAMHIKNRGTSNKLSNEKLPSRGVKILIILIVISFLLIVSTLYTNNKFGEMVYLNIIVVIVSLGLVVGALIFASIRSSNKKSE